MTDTATRVDTNCINDDEINNIGSNAESVQFVKLCFNIAKACHPQQTLRREGPPQEQRI